jgi:uncharacterized protein YlxW (UPF0749 family)
VSGEIGPPTKPASPDFASPDSERSRRTFKILVPVIAAFAGLLAATAVATSRGGQLPGQHDNLPGLVADRQAAVAKLDKKAQQLRAAVDKGAGSAAAGSQQVRIARSQEAALGGVAGLTAVSGAGLTVSLDDAPRSARDQPEEPGVPTPTANDLVVHQQDVQAALNGLRAGGAQALTVMGQRVIATTAVRCVGNTLLVNGRVYSPPFVIAALGDPQQLRSGVDAEPGVQIFRQYVAAYGLKLDVTTGTDLKMPAYTGAVGLVHAVPADH